MLSLFVLVFPTSILTMSEMSELFANALRTRLTYMCLVPSLLSYFTKRVSLIRNFVIFAIIVIFGILVTFVNPLSLLSFSDLLYLPILLPWRAIFVIFGIIVNFGIFVTFVKPLANVVLLICYSCYNCYFRYSFFHSCYMCFFCDCVYFWTYVETICCSSSHCLRFSASVGDTQILNSFAI